MVEEEDDDDAVSDVTPIPVEPESGSAELPTVKAIEVDATSDPKGTESVVSHGIGSLSTPPFLTTDLPSPQVDLMKGEPVPSEGLPSFVPRWGNVTHVLQSL